MIRITKPEAPEILQKRGKTKAKAHCEAFDKATKEEHEKEGFFKFDSKIYADEAVKTALKTAQNMKCAFCETEIVRAYGDVEHFRPKGAWKQDTEDSLHYPGYYWLAYDWDNLFFACQFCNQKFKENLFPLENHQSRLQSHHDNISKEKPLLIHPCNDDPQQYIGFRASRNQVVAYPINNNIRATITIKTFGINEDRQLVERRFKVYERVRDYMNDLKKCLARPHPDNELKEHIHYLRSKIAEYRQGEYSSMIQTLLKEFGE